MGGSHTLRSVLLHLRKQSLKLPAMAGDERERLLVALLLQLACAQYHRDRGALKTMAQLYALAAQLCPLPPPAPFPTSAEFERALELVPAAPPVVAALDPCVIAFAYQFFCFQYRENARKRLQSANKEPDQSDIIAFTQLYTPTEIVDRLIASAMPAWRVRGGIGEHPTAIDPSCGAGNFLWRVFDQFAPDNVSRADATKAAEDICRNALAGCDIDPIALWVCALGFAPRLLKLGISEVDWKLRLELPADRELGSLSGVTDDKSVLAKRYDMVLGNPPYLGRKLLDRPTKERLRALYPNCHQDLCAAFIERGLELLNPGGRLAYITQSSLLYLPTYSQFRKRLVTEFSLISIAELGAGTFLLQSGEKVNSMLLVIERTAGGDNLVEFVDEKQSATFHRQQKEFLQQRGNAFNYRCPNAFLRIKAESQRLSDIADVRQGLATTDNKRFVRHRSEVAPSEIGSRWMPYAKGAGSERWYAPIDSVVDWADNGAAIKQAVQEAYPYLNGKTEWVIKNERFYFRKGLTFSLVNTKQLAVRELPEGCIFDVAGSAVFTESADEKWLLAYLNSSLISAFARILNPTINYQVGDLKELPVIPLTDEDKSKLAALADQCVELKRAHNLDELVTCEAAIDAIVLRAAESLGPFEDWTAVEALCNQCVSLRHATGTSHEQSTAVEELSASSSRELSRSRS